MSLILLMGRALVNMVTDVYPLMASVNDEAYLIKAFDTNRNDYRSKLIHSLGVNIGVCFQIKGW